MITKQVLKQYRYILLENADLEKRIRRTREQLEKLESGGNVVDTVRGGEGGIQHFKIEGFPVAEYSQKKTRLQWHMLRYEKNMAVLSQIEQEVCEFLDNIPDSRTRLIFRYYYEDGMPQEQIARRIHLEQPAVSKEIEKYLASLQ